MILTIKGKGVQPWKNTARAPLDTGDLEEKIKKIKGAKGPVKAFVMGKSVLGRSIYALGMGQLRQPALMVEPPMGWNPSPQRC